METLAKFSGIAFLLLGGLRTASDILVGLKEATGAFTQTPPGEGWKMLAVGILFLAVAEIISNQRKAAPPQG